MATFVSNVLAGIGLLAVSSTLYSTLSFVRLHTRTGNVDRYKHASKPSWVLITGASDGIGYAFAQELASRGFNLVLHGRNPAKLEAKKAELESQYPKTKVELVIADVSSPDALENAKKVAAAVADKRLTILINNISVAVIRQRIYKTFDQLDPAEIESMVDLNIRFTAHLNKLVLPQLKNGQPALVLNIGSLASLFFTPYVTLYSGVKAYQRGYSNALTWEMESENIDVEVIHITYGEVVSSSVKGPVGLTKPSARVAAAAALSKVGCGQREVIPYWGHDLNARIASSLPYGMLTSALIKTMTGLRDVEDAELKTQ